MEVLIFGMCILEGFVRKKIYLDTSVISCLRQEEVPQRMSDTLEFWEILKSGIYDVYISDVVIEELARCYEPRRSELFSLLAEIHFSTIDIRKNEEIENIVDEIRNMHIIPPKYDDDRAHIAAAIYTRCNIIVSWNFKHLVNVKTIDGVRIICIENNLTPVDIYTPTMLLERRDSHE